MGFFWEEYVMKTLHALVVLALMVILAGCALLTDPASDGSYRYTSYDTTGAVLVRGWFTMDISDSNTISGEWHFAAVDSAKNIGPQTGDGKLVGGIQGTTVWIELNPHYRDNNLGLHGTLQGNRFSGTWTWISFVGITNQGPFEAVKY
jgi:hypothetical protein